MRGHNGIDICAARVRALHVVRATSSADAGLLGSGTQGRGGDNVSVNAATGNLLISRQDEFLVGRGPDASISRTYNSLAQMSDGDNGDQWQQSTMRRGCSD